MKNWTSPHLIRCNDLFWNFNMKKLTGKGNIKRVYKCQDKKALAKQIFLRYLYILFTDFLQGGKTFIFPGRNTMEMRMTRIPRDKFINARKAGKYLDVDVIMSQQLCYEPVLTYKKRDGMQKHSAIKLSNDFRQLLIDKVNTGYKYC